MPELHQVTQATYTTEVTQQKHEEMVASVETPALEVGAEGVDRIWIKELGIWRTI
ncbi:MAG: hypothetical protein IPK72_16150 [Candidatus Eisenbacteria bacterium]|nr:hypothetical protein [Candidatus Eisenbacteria bacterium]